MTAPDGLAAVTGALTADERRVIEFFTGRAYRDLAGLDTAAILAAFARRGDYAGQLGEFTAANPDLAADPRTGWAALAVLRLGRLLTRPTVTDLLAR